MTQEDISQEALLFFADFYGVIEQYPGIAPWEVEKIEAISDAMEKAKTRLERFG